MAEAKIKIQLFASPNGCPEPQKRVVKGLGLRKINQVVEKPDTPAFHGMVKKIPHLVRIVS